MECLSIKMKSVQFRPQWSCWWGSNMWPFSLWTVLWPKNWHCLCFWFLIFFPPDCIFMHRWINWQPEVQQKTNLFVETHFCFESLYLGLFSMNQNVGCKSFHLLSNWWTRWGRSTRWRRSWTYKCVDRRGLSSWRSPAGGHGSPLQSLFSTAAPPVTLCLCGEYPACLWPWQVIGIERKAFQLPGLQPGG